MVQRVGIIAERVKGGLRKAKANGKQLGRPNSDIDINEVVKCKENGMSIREIAKELGLSRDKVERTLKLGVSKTIESCTSLY